MIARGTIFAIGLLVQATVAAAGCDADARSTWQTTDNRKFAIEAISSGPSCEKAVLLLVIRDAKRTPVFTFAAPAGQIGPFAWEPANAPKVMTEALHKWIAPRGEPRSMAGLPPWKQGADQPAADPPQEFPFMTNEQLSREDYEDWRTRKLPLFCFVTGMESETCLANPEGSSVREVGLQLFPG